jgi:RNA polymerase sigma-B factor
VTSLTANERARDCDAAYELLRRWDEQRDEHAREELCRHYMPLAQRLARRYRTPHESLDDLIQVASVGLLAAIDRFDPGRGAKFTSFAVPTILGELKRHFRKTGWSAHVPRGAQELAVRVERAAREITSRSGRSPRVDELAAYLEITVEEVLSGLDAARAHFADSLDTPAAGPESDELPTLGDRIGTEDERFGLVDLKLSVSAAMARLPDLERKALTLRIEHDLQQREIARRLGCSQMQVSRLLRRATARVHELTDPDPERRPVCAGTLPEPAA